MLPWNDAKDLTLKLRVAKTGEEEQRAPAKRQRRKRPERRQEAQKDFGDFGVKQIWSKGEKCGNMVDDLDEMEIHAHWVGGEVWGNLHSVMRAELAAVILSWGVRWRCDWVCLGLSFLR